MGQTQNENQVATITSEGAIIESFITIEGQEHIQVESEKATSTNGWLSTGETLLQVGRNQDNEFYRTKLKVELNKLWISADNIINATLMFESETINGAVIINNQEITLDNSFKMDITRQLKKGEDIILLGDYNTQGTYASFEIGGTNRLYIEIELAKDDKIKKVVEENLW